jgi:hypothetical protein
MALHQATHGVESYRRNEREDRQSNAERRTALCHMPVALGVKVSHPSLCVRDVLLDIGVQPERGRELFFGSTRFSGFCDRVPKPPLLLA